MGSNRLPGKSLMKLGDKYLIDHVIERSLEVSDIKSFYLATTSLSEDDVLVDHVKRNYKLTIHRGDSLNVRSRFYEIANLEGCDLIVRITGDDPFKDPDFISFGINHLVANKLDYVCNFEPRFLPIGMDFEVFTRESFFRSINEFTNAVDIEHVTWNLRSNHFKWKSIQDIQFQPETRITVDDELDLEYCDQISKILSTSPSNYSWSWTQKAISIMDKRSL